MLTSLDHLSIAVRDLKAASERWGALLGREPAWHSAVDGIERARFQLDNIALEIVAPSATGANDGNADLRSHLDRVGEGIWTLAFATSALAETRRVLERRGVASSDAHSGTSILAQSATHGPNLQLIEQQSAIAQPRFGGRDNANGEPIGLDHVVVTTAQPERAIALYGAKLGLEMKLDRTNPDWGSRLIFFRCGDSIVEIAHSLKTIDSTTPDKIWGVTWRVADIERAALRIANAGFAISEIRSGRKPGTRVCTVRDAPANVPTLLLEKISREGANG